MIGQVQVEMIRYFGKDARRINHALKVYGFASAIAGNENVSAEERFIISLAAILHDIGIPESERKYNSSAGKYQELEGPPIARDIMKRVGIADEAADRVCFLVGHHHTYGKIDGIDFQVLVEADFLVNCFEGEMSVEEISKISEKYFKTVSGSKIIKSMYL